VQLLAKNGIIVAIIITIFSSVVHASSINPQRRFCKQFSTPSSKTEFINSLLKSENRLSFLNQGGEFNIGVCWWHSRFQRAASYLAYYEPEKNKPSEEEVEEIINAIIYQKRVVSIPGFSSLSEFSKAHEKQIQSALESWQIRDSLTGALARSLNPLRPSYKSYTKDIVHTFYRLHQLINDEKVIPFVIEQNTGATAHAYLIVKAQMLGKNVVDQEIELTLIDSNSFILSTVRISKYNYDRIEYQNIKFEGFAIYIDYSRDLTKIERAIKQFCPHTPIHIAPDFIDKYEY